MVRNTERLLIASTLDSLVELGLSHEVLHSRLLSHCAFPVGLTTI